MMRGAIQGKIPPIEGEDGVDPLATGQINQRGIGQLRTDVLVLLHHIGNGAGLRAGEREQFQKAALPTRTAASQKLLDSPRMGTQEPRSLGDYRPAGKQRAGELMKGLDASGVVPVDAGENGHQRSSVDQYAARHLDFPNPSKWRGLQLRSRGGEFGPRLIQPINPAASASS